MSESPSPYYFRIRENGAAVFKIENDPRQRRLDFEEIASLNIRNGAIKPHGNHTLSDQDLAAITAWISTRQSALALRESSLGADVIEQLNLLTQHLQSKASDAEIEALSDPLLFAMHDLRSLLIRKKAERLTKTDQA